MFNRNLPGANSIQICTVYAFVSMPNYCIGCSTLGRRDPMLPLPFRIALATHLALNAAGAIAGPEHVMFIDPSSPLAEIAQLGVPAGCRDRRPRRRQCYSQSQGQAVVVGAPAALEALAEAAVTCSTKIAAITRRNAAVDHGSSAAAETRPLVPRRSDDFCRPTLRLRSPGSRSARATAGIAEASRNPISRRLVCAPRPIMRWSCMAIPIAFAAWNICTVRAMSAPDGVGSPDG